MATYNVSNFLAKPSSEDTRLRIYDKNKNLKYTLIPNISNFFVKANIVVIKIEDKNDIYLDFPNVSDAKLALTLLNQAKKEILNKPEPTPPSTSPIIYSKGNLNMVGSVTVEDGDLACSIAIVDNPICESHVRVYINGIEVNVGGAEYPFDCFFSPDGGNTIRDLSDAVKGDKLYWNQSVAGYNIDERDLIDFVFLMEKKCSN